MSKSCSSEKKPFNFLSIILCIIICMFFVSLISCQSISGELSSRSWIEEKGIVYGAKPNKIGPIGGGAGYRNIVTKGDYTVSSFEELKLALKSVIYGETIFIPGNVVLDYTALIFAEDYSIQIPSGVIFASDRGYKGSKGALLKSLAYNTPSLIEFLGPDVRLTGFRIEGPDKERHLIHYSQSYISQNSLKDEKKTLNKEYFYSFPNSRGISTDYGNIEIDNCEIWGWSHAAIYLRIGEDNRIHHNYIHHNQRQGLGYGISHNTAFSYIEYNHFNFNRHSIAGTGRIPSGYVARHNIELNESLSHSFDMHGGRDRKDGTNIAGSTIIISNNTFYSQARAIAIRGVPEKKAMIFQNWFFQKSLSSDVILDWHLINSIKIGLNKFDSTKGRK